MDSTPIRQSNLTNKDFRELIKSHVPIKREYSEETITEGKKENKVKKAKLKKYDQKKRDDSLELLLSRYRDRARERREGKNPDYLCTSDDLTDPIAYHAVAPDAEYNIRLAERRKQLIQESKYLGGDMAHTHLVKGLDFALLNKVRSEIEARTKEVQVEPVVEEDTDLKGQMAKNIHDILFKSTPLVKNPLFVPGKMCYLVDLKEEKQIGTDVPTTVIRSKILETDDGKTIITTDAIINKIREVLQGAKEDSKYRKLKRIEPPPEHHEQKKEEKKTEIRNNEKVRVSKTEAMLKKLIDEPNGYAECYPGAEAMLEAEDGSDCEDMPLQLGVACNGDHQPGHKKAPGRKMRPFAKRNSSSLDREWNIIKNRLQL